jgi:hypothetical protein
MGPNLLIDKSALEQLAPQELAFLDRHFFLVLPPILLEEIQAEIGKANVPGRTPERWVTTLARKLGLNALGNDPWQSLCLTELMGWPVPMERKCVSGAIERVETRTGAPGIRIGVSAGDKQTEQWRLRPLTDAEREEGLRFRRAARSKPPSDYITHCRHLKIPIARPVDGDQLRSQVNALISRSDLAPNLLALLALEIGFTRSEWRTALARYRVVSGPLGGLAAYAEFCARVLLSFSAGLLNSSIVGGRATDRLDTDYLFYLPFCQVFCSGDGLHERLAPLLLGPDQDFVGASVLKADLSRIADDWGRLTADERRLREILYGRYPQDDPDSIVASLWRRHRRPWKPFSGNLLPTLSDEERAALEELARQFKEDG